MTEKPQNKPQDIKLNKDIKKISNKSSLDIKSSQPKQINHEEKDQALKTDENESKESKEMPAKLEQKTDEKSIEKKEDNKPKIDLKKKDEAVARGLNLHASKKHCMYISNFIKGKSIDRSIKELGEVIKFKRAIPFKGEIPHRSQPGIMSGRYPIKASKQFISLLKGLKGNAETNGLDLNKTRIYFASSTWDSRPSKKGGMRFKRAFVVLKAKEFNKNITENKEIKK